MQYFTFRDFQFEKTTYCLVVGVEWAQKQIEALDPAEWITWSFSRINKEALLAHDKDNLESFFEVSKCNVSFDEFVETIASLVTAFYYLNGGNSDDYRDVLVNSLFKAQKKDTEAQL